MPNIDLTCIECQNGFYFSEKDQEWFKTKGFQTPKRCFACRQARKTSTVSADQSTAGNGDGNRRDREDSYNYNK